MANNEKKASSKLAKLENIYPAHNFFDESSKDEARHARMLKGLLERYF
jgi:rubrerythrin